MQEKIRPAIAEFIGTFFLIFFGCGAILIDQNLDGAFGLQGIAFAFGLIVMAIVYALGHVSGAHINPAVTIALACIRKFSWSSVPTYILAQCLGSVAAALLLSVTLATGDALGMTLPAGDLSQAFLMEVILTAFLLFVVLGVGSDSRTTDFTALAAGAVIIVDVLVGGAITGASMNPARSLGPALVRMNFEHLWLYFLAPIVGGILGAVLYKMCSKVNKP